MVNFLSSIFGSLRKQLTPVEKVLKNTCFTRDSFQEVEYDDIVKVTQFLVGKTETNSSEAVAGFFKYIKESKELSIQKRIKFLILIHKSIKKLGFEFAEIFLSERLNVLREKMCESQTQTSSKKHPLQIAFRYNDIENWLEEYVVKHYYDYLMRLALNVETFKACQAQTQQTTTMQTIGQTKTTENPLSPREGMGIKFNEDFENHPMHVANTTMRLLLLFKINNQLNFLIKLQKQFYIIFTEFKFIFIAKDIAYLVLKDCMIYYNYLHRQIMQMVNNYEAMIESDQMQFYELFIELIKLNSALLEFGKLRKFFDEEEQIEQPLPLTISKERARQIDKNQRKIVLKNNEMQKNRRLILQQSQNGMCCPNTSRPSSNGQTARFSFPKATGLCGGSMTTRATSWLRNDQIREETNDDEEDDITAKVQLKKQHRKGNSLAFTGGKFNLNLNLENICRESQEDHEDYHNVIGFNTDRIVLKSSSDEQIDDIKSLSTKETKKEEDNE